MRNCGAGCWGESACALGQAELGGSAYVTQGGVSRCPNRRSVRLRSSAELGEEGASSDGACAP